MLDGNYRCNAIYFNSKSNEKNNLYCRYLSIIKEEGLEISQPAIDADKSEIHHKLTARQEGSRVHRYNHDKYLVVSWIFLKSFNVIVETGGQ